MSAHDLMDNTMRVWSTKITIPKRGKGFSPGDERDENEFKLQ